MGCGRDTVWLGMKYADGQFLASNTGFAGKYGVSSRTIEIVRAKMKKLGLIQRVSHFSPAFGNRPGWAFSPGFRHSLPRLGEMLKESVAPSGRAIDRTKDEGSMHYT